MEAIAAGQQTCGPFSFCGHLPGVGSESHEKMESKSSQCRLHATKQTICHYTTSVDQLDQRAIPVSRFPSLGHIKYVFNIADACLCCMWNLAVIRGVMFSLLSIS